MASYVAFALSDVFLPVCIPFYEFRHYHMTNVWSSPFAKWCMSRLQSFRNISSVTLNDSQEQPPPHHAAAIMWETARGFLISITVILDIFRHLHISQTQRLGNWICFVGFQLLTAVLIKSTTISWDVTLCCPVEVHRRFAGSVPPSLGRKSRPSK
jgi:hypothetical protein